MRTLSTGDTDVFLAAACNNRPALRRMLASDHPDQLREIVSSLDGRRNKFQLDTPVNAVARTLLAASAEEVKRIEADAPLTSELCTFDGSNLIDSQGRVVEATRYQLDRVAAIKHEIAAEEVKRLKEAAARELKKQQRQQEESFTSKANQPPRGAAKARAIKGQGRMKKQQSTPKQPSKPKKKTKGASVAAPSPAPLVLSLPALSPLLVQPAVSVDALSNHSDDEPVQRAAPYVECDLSDDDSSARTEEVDDEHEDEAMEEPEQQQQQQEPLLDDSLDRDAANMESEPSAENKVEQEEEKEEEEEKKDGAASESVEHATDLSALFASLDDLLPHSAFRLCPAVPDVSAHPVHASATQMMREAEHAASALLHQPPLEPLQFHPPPPPPPPSSPFKLPSSAAAHLPRAAHWASELYADAFFPSAALPSSSSVDDEGTFHHVFNPPSSSSSTTHSSASASESASTSSPSQPLDAFDPDGFLAV
jgi:hypothetical protein